MGVTGGDLERITVNLTPPSSRALAQAVQATGLCKTDCVNTAVRMFGFLAAQQAQGAVLYVREGAGEELTRLQII